MTYEDYVKQTIKEMGGRGYISYDGQLLNLRDFFGSGSENALENDIRQKALLFTAIAELQLLLRDKQALFSMFNGKQWKNPQPSIPVSKLKAILPPPGTVIAFEIVPIAEAYQKLISSLHDLINEAESGE